MRHITSNDLPEDIARRAEAQVAAGRFASVEEVVRASVEAMDAYQETVQEWLHYVRQEARDGFAEIERGEFVKGTPAEIMSSIRAEAANRIKQEEA